MRKRKHVSLRISEVLYDKIQTIAEKNDESFSSVINTILEKKILRRK